MKVGVPFALVGAIVGEFMAATAGLGFKIQLYTAQFDTTGAVTGVLVLMVVVIMFNTALNGGTRAALAAGISGASGSTFSNEDEEIAIVMTDRPGSLSRRAFCLRPACSPGAPAIVRAQGLVEGQNHEPAESLSYMPIYVGRAKEFFEEVGIDLESVVTRGDGPDVQALMAKEVEFVATPPHHLYTLYLQNRKLLGIAGHPRPLRYQHRDQQRGGGRTRRHRELAVREETCGA